LQYSILKRIAPHEPTHLSGDAYRGKSKLQVFFGKDLFQQAKGEVVIDFGCGEGREAIEIAQKGARKVIGLDIRETVLERARANAIEAGVSTLCQFEKSTNAVADIIITIDSFEHFADPSQALTTMYDLLKPGGILMVSFGPPWYHPYGGHFFSVFPWAHLLFTEAALIRWRSDIRNDGARCFREVAGGLNQMTVGRFERLVRDSGFLLEKLEMTPIRRLEHFHNRVTREFTTSVLRCILHKPSGNC
jgi:SAM-dependent methyltransferase